MHLKILKLIFIAFTGQPSIHSSIHYAWMLKIVSEVWTSDTDEFFHQQLMNHDYGLSLVFFLFHSSTSLNWNFWHFIFNVLLQWKCLMLLGLAVGRSFTLTRLLVGWLRGLWPFPLRHITSRFKPPTIKRASNASCNSKHRWWPAGLTSHHTQSRTQDKMTDDLVDGLWAIWASV